jgi:hypothetical protein
MELAVEIANRNPLVQPCIDGHIGSYFRLSNFRRKKHRLPDMSLSSVAYSKCEES